MVKERTGKRRDMAAIRADFPLLQREMNGQPLVFLDSAASSQKPDSVIQCIDHYYRYQHANIHRGVYQLSQQATDAYEESRHKVRDFIHADSEREILFVRGATEGINLVAHSFGRRYFQPGDEVLISAMEHHSNIVPWQLAAEIFGIEIKVIPINSKGEILLDEYEQLLSEKTRMVSIVHVSNTLGTINPVKSMIEKAHEVGAAVLVDGCQAAPHLPIDVQELDADFYTFSGHKVFGPTGIGVLYGKAKWLEEMPPYHGGGEMIDQCTFEGTTWNELPFKFEAGTPNIAGGIGLGAAVDYMQSIDQKVALAHEQQLLSYATEKLSSIEGVTIVGTADQKASLLSFNVEGLHHYDVGTLLDQQGVAVRTGHHCTQPLMDLWGIPGTIRASFALYNNFTDVDRLYEALVKAIQLLR